ncbi:glycosyl transferase [Corallococcus sp. AB030]|uniref:ceramide glucosyltransferase n=1 Tax=unclassified Corallococcus TaxID=2685029 RepID=UPI000EA15018|nr:MULTISPECIES: ceramide glucosyltransferase [unclassified Corallococcus]RKH18602.1 glycosyl transferase [Corallococcus sp. CA041A]RKI18627.1 glycosyl transferase [Corallococcus sp. AB030]RUO93341.1 glycosyl transferase [Corallococcus sp. AB018]
MLIASSLLLAASAVGLVALLLQALFVRRHRRTVPAGPTHRPGLSILKPLCGVDDDLEANLACFARLPYPHYEVLLGVKDARDPAYAVARAAQAKWPHVMRVVLQEGEPGLNPKVNQLVTLSSEARFDLWVVSDSNTRVGDGYLEEIAAGFEDPTVGCVTHPVAGLGEKTFGSLLDNLHLSSSAAAGMIAAKHVADRDIVVGKSMALRREDVEALGGFFSVKDVLAEDYVIGQWVTRKLGKRVVLAHAPVFNVSLRKSVDAFFQRYLRWSVIHRTAVSPSTYLAQALLNPVPLAVLGALIHPSALTGLAALAVALGKVWVDVAVFRSLRPQPVSLRAAPAVLVKDALLFAAWWHGAFRRTVDWRGTRLRVVSGTRLVPMRARGTPATEWIPSNGVG